MLFILTSLGAAQGAELSPTERVKLLAELVAHQLENTEKRYQYTYDEKEVMEELNEDCSIKKTETKTYSWQFTRLHSLVKLTSINSASYDDSYLKAQDNKIRETIAQESRMSEGERRQLREKAIQERNQENALYINLLEAFDFDTAGREALNGFGCWALNFSPKPGFKPKSRELGFLKSLRGKIWITEESQQLVRLTGTLEEDASYGAGIFGSLKRGTTVTLEQADIGNGLWFPTFNIITYKASLLILGTHKRQISQYSNYQFNAAYSHPPTVEVEHLP